MIGRELLRDPFLPMDIKESLDHSLDVLKIMKPIDEKRKPLIRAYHDDLLDTFSSKINRQEALVGKMKSYWYYLESLFPGCEKEMETMKRILKLDEYIKWVDNIFLR